MASKNLNSDEKAAVPAYYGYGYPNGIDSGSDGGLSITDLIGLARRRWEIIVISVAVGTIAAAAWGYQLPITYSATAKLLIEPENRVVDLDSVIEAVGSDAATIETQLNLLKSGGFLEKFVESERFAELSEAHALRQLQFMKDTVSQTSTKTNAALAAQEDPSQGEIDMTLEVYQEASRLANGLNVIQQGRSFIIDIVFTSTNPREAAQTVNDLAAFYIDSQANRRRTVTGEASRVIGERLKELESELLEAEEAVHHYRIQNPNTTGGDTGFTGERLSDLTSILVRTRAERKEKEARLAYIRQLRRNDATIDSLTEVLRSPHMASLWEQDSSLRKQEAELRLEFGANHPSILSLNEERIELENRMSSETDRIVDNVANELQVLREREKSLEQDMDQLTTVANDATQSSDHASIRLRLLEGQAETSRRIYEEFLIRLKQTREQEEFIQATTRLVASAKVPTIPSSSSPLRMALLGFVASSAVGFGFAFLRDKTDRRLRNGKDIGDSLKIPFLGAIPFLSDKERENRPFHDFLRRKRASRYTESIRSVFTQMTVMSELEEPPKVILVTSTMPNEGKTTFVTSLATMLSLDEKKTLILDLDFRNPSVYKSLDLDDDDNIPDFEAFLSGKNDDNESLVTTLKTGCHVIGIESAAKDPGKLLRSSRLSKLIDTFRENYDVIIVDGPPSLGLSDSKALLSLIDSLIFVVRWNKTATDMAVEAVDELTRCHANIGGAVLTQINLKKQSRYGYAGSGHYPGKDESYYND